MKKYLIDLFSEASPSSIGRVGFILLVICGIYISIYSIHSNKDCLGVVTVIFSTATTLKIGQKIVEGKSKKNNE